MKAMQQSDAITIESWLTPSTSRRASVHCAAEQLAQQYDGLDAVVMEAAYDDSFGLTAEFNRNVLHVINRELDGDFDVDAFEHVAFFDHDQEWIEMRLRARRAMAVRVDAIALDVTFAEGEELRTEISAKFTIDRVRADFAAASLILNRWLTDAHGRFALSPASRARLAGCGRQLGPATT